MFDEEIVDLILSSQSPQYFEELYDRHALKVFQKCISFTKDEDEAKDVAHDVIVKIYLSLSKFNKKSKFSTWMYAITYNYCVDYYAKKKKQLTLAEELLLEKGNDTAIEEVSDHEILEIKLETLNQLLKKLTPAETSILLMKYQDGLSIKDIAEQTGNGESSIKMKLKRTKAKLMKLHGDWKRR